MKMEPPESTVTPERLLQRLEWHVLRRLDGILQGDYRTLFYGHGLDFADLREYQPGDDIRYIDWNVTARTNHPHVRNFVEDREITAWFLLDLSRSMQFGPAERQKQTVLIDLVVTLARALTRIGNRVGAIFYSGEIAGTLPPGGSRNHVLRLARLLLDGFPTPAGGPTDLNRLLAAGLNTFRRRSLVFVVSDFFSEPGWAAGLGRLNARHELIAVRLWDPLESELPDAGFIMVEDAETGEQLFVDTSQAAFRRRFYEAAARRENDLKAQFHQAGVDSFSVSTRDDLLGTILQIASLRKRLRRRPVRQVQTR